ncbi:SdrD B-like domain-containing protein [Rubellicoccus peritrichatus]|uniref:SdrD B-like domain-containing protein n=1 Tax=Rubellicoccus peritrichatus TaxID=3080537 RepID=A0AAQ3QX65_9BACT|nr:SdrD B-like domain-containing protein [Puniceicoccus sp. CR14]WOO42570.1 SdrD B-like domain-containing protein [Puniceicoccus sp. CR14]
MTRFSLIKALLMRLTTIRQLVPNRNAFTLILIAKLAVMTGASANTAPAGDLVLEGITVDADSLTFTSTNDGGWSASGQSTVTFGSESFTVTMEDTDGNDGLLIDSGNNLISLTAMVETDFEFYGASFAVDSDNPLTFIYDSDDAQYIFFGSASLEFNDGSNADPLTVTLGDADTPGLIIDGGDLSGFSFGITDDMTYDGVVIEIGSAGGPFTFVYDSMEDLYESYGDVSIRYDGTDTTFTATLGNIDNPGIVLSSNDSSQLILESLNATVSGSFSVDSLDFDVDALTLIYNQSTDFYEIDGTVSVAIESNMVSATFGYDAINGDGSTTSYPGMRIKDGDLVGVDFIIMESIDIAGVTIETIDDGIGFSHTGIDDYYYAFGGIQISFGDQDVEFDAGTYDSPGIILSADAITYALELELLLISVSGDMNFYGVEFVPDDVTINYSKIGNADYSNVDNVFEIYGDITVGVDGVDVSGFLGTSDNPGFAFADGVLNNFDVGISESITLSGLTIETTGDYLGVSYNETSEVFELFGGLSVTFDNQTLGIQAGTSDAPGMELVGDSNNHFVLQSLDATLTADFSLYGIDINLGDDGVTFIYNSTDDLYEVYGEVDVVIEGDEIDAFLGDADTPGFEIEGGIVESVDIGISTDISLGGFEFKSPEDNPLTITYTSDNTTYTVYGEAELDALWDTVITLGDSDNPGIEIVDNTWMIDDLAIEVDRINLGFAQLQEVAVDYSRDNTDEIIVDITVDIYIPELEGEVDAEVVVDNGKISDIFLEYKATGTSEGIEVLDTGVDVAEMSVTLENLDQPADLIFDGTIGLEFGGQIGIGSTDVTLAYMEGEVYVDKTKLVISDSVYFGAYEDGDDWDALIFRGDGEMNINWANQVYSLSSDVYLPSDYGFKITDKLVITSEYIIMQASAEVRVPSGIPLIGGEDLGEIDFDLLVDMEDGSKSFAAAWVEIHMFGDTEEAGIKYKFDGGDIVFIGSGDIDNINNDIEDVEQTIENEGITYAQQTYTFEFEGASSFIADMSWYLDDGSGTVQDISEMKITMTGTIIDLVAEKTYHAQPLSMTVMDFTDGAFTTKADGDSGSGSLLLDFTNSQGAKVSTQGWIKQSPINGETVIDELVPGTVVITFQYPESLELGGIVTINEPTITQYDGLAKPSVLIADIEDDDAVITSVSAFNPLESCHDAWSSVDHDNLFTYSYSSYKSAWCVTSDSTDSVLHAGQKLDINLHATAPDKYAGDTYITIFADTDNTGHDGTPIMSNIPYNSEGDITTLGYTYRIFDMVWTVKNVTQVQDGTVYFYASISNGQQSTGYSAYSDAFTIESPVYGVVYDTDKTNPLEGFRVFLDTDGDFQYDASSEPSTLTDSEGNYVFDDVDTGSVTIGVVVPHGYQDNDTDKDLVTTTYVSNESTEVDFDVNLLDSISGYVFEDTNSDGLFDDDESGIQGVMLFLDQNDNDTYDANTDLKTVTNDDGFWRFYDVETDTTYDVHILAYPSQLSTHDENYITVDTTTQTTADTEDMVVASFAVASSQFDPGRVSSAVIASSEPVDSSTDTRKYTEFGDHNFGVYPTDVDQVRDRKYMSYILFYFPDDIPGITKKSIDPDNDGLSNKIEQLLNTDPNIANTSPVPIIVLGGSGLGTPGEDNLILVEYDVVASNRYEIQASSDLQTWETIDSFRATKTEPVILEIYTDLDSERAFFRISVTD